MENSGMSTPGYTGTAGGSGGDPSMMDQAKQQTQQVAGQVVEQGKQMAGQVVDRAKEQVATQLSGQKEKATESLGTVASALRQTGEQLRSQNQAPVADLTARAAEMVEGVSGYLRDRDVQDLTRDMEDFARRQPALVIGGAFLLGFLASRFLKSSGQSASGQYNGGYESGANYYQTDRVYGTETTGMETGRPLASAYDRALTATGPTTGTAMGGTMGATGDAMGATVGGSGVDVTDIDTTSSFADATDLDTVTVSDTIDTDETDQQLSGTRRRRG